MCSARGGHVRALACSLQKRKRQRSMLKIILQQNVRYVIHHKYAKEGAILNDNYTPYFMFSHSLTLSTTKSEDNTMFMKKVKLLAFRRCRKRNVFGALVLRWRTEPVSSCAKQDGGNWLGHESRHTTSETARLLLAVCSRAGICAMRSQ